MATQAKKASFESILNTPLSSIEPPKQIPSGSYVAMVLGPPPDEPSKASTGTQYYQFNLQLMQAEEDVNKVDLQTALTKMDGTVMALREKTLRSDRYYLTQQSLFRLLKFFKDLGICDENGKAEDGTDLDILEAVAMTPGRQVRIYVTHTTSPAGVLYANVTQTSPVV